MATKNSLYVTSDTKPATVTVGEIPDVVSIKGVTGLEPQTKKKLGKEAGFCIATDLDLSKARSIISIKTAEKMFSSKLLSRTPTLPEISCSYDPAAIAASIAKIPDAIDGAIAELEYLENRYLLAKDAEELCRNLEQDCPICPNWPDTLEELSLARLYGQFTTIVDKLISFGDPKLLEMFLRCPEFMLKSSVKQLNSMADSITGDGQVNMLKTLVQAGNPLKLIDLKSKIRESAKNSDNDASSELDMQEILAAANIAKEDLVVAEAYGHTETIYSNDSVSEMAESGTTIMQSVLPKETQQMSLAVSKLLASKASTPMFTQSGGTSGSGVAPLASDSGTVVKGAVVTEFMNYNKISGVWQDPSGYVHITNPYISKTLLDQIYAHNRAIRRKKPRGLPVEVLDMRPNAGDPIDLNGCAAI